MNAPARRGPRLAICLAAALCGIAGDAWAQASVTAADLGGRHPPAGHGSRTHGRGRTHHARRPPRRGVWQRALPARDFIQIDPQNGQPATEPTEVRIVFSERRASTWASPAYDSEPDKWLGYQRRRDEFLASDDRFMWTHRHVPRRALRLLLRDEPLGPDGRRAVRRQRREPAWDGIWNARVRRSEIGWTIEIEIPFRTLNFNPNSDTWGINFQRTVRRKNEDSIWMGWARNQGLDRMTNAGHVTGITRRHAGHRASTSSRTACCHAEASPGRGDRQLRSRRERGRRPLLQPDAGPAHEPHGQHRLRADRGRSAAGQPDALLAVLSRAARLLPRRRHVLRLRQHQRQRPGAEQVQPVLQPPHRPERRRARRRRSTSAPRSPARSAARTSASCTSARATTTTTASSARTSRWRASSAGCCSSRTSARIYTRRDCARRRRRTPATRPASISASPPAGSSASRISTSRAGSCTPRGPRSRTRQQRLRRRRRLSQRPLVRAASTPARSRSNFDPAVGFVTRRDYRRYNQFVGFGPRPREHRVRPARSVRRRPGRPHRPPQRPARAQRQPDAARTCSSSRRTSFAVGRHRTPTSGSTRPSPSAAASRCRWAPSTTTPASRSGQTANRRMLALNGRYETGGFYSGTRRQTIAGLTVRARPGYIFSFNGEWNTSNWPRAASRRTCSA